MAQLTLSWNPPTAMRKESNEVILGEHRRQFYFIQFIPMTKRMKGPSILVRIKRADTPTELKRKIVQLVISERARTKTRIQHGSAWNPSTWGQRQADPGISLASLLSVISERWTLSSVWKRGSRQWGRELQRKSLDISVVASACASTSQFSSVLIPASFHSDIHPLYAP